MPPVTDRVSSRNRPTLALLYAHCAEEEPTLREVLYLVGFSLSFCITETADGEGAIVEILGEIALKERITLAVDVLSDFFSISRYGARLLVMPHAEACAQVAA